MRQSWMEGSRVAGCWVVALDYSAESMQRFLPVATISWMDRERAQGMQRASREHTEENVADGRWRSACDGQGTSWGPR